LYGLGGAGKTSVAVEYAHRHLAEGGVAWQFPAEDSTVLAAGFGELAAQLGVRGLRALSGGAPFRTRWASTVTMLRFLSGVPVVLGNFGRISLPCTDARTADYLKHLKRS
jgi:hypothetical protein